jgi:hypothetical protein
MCKADNKRVFDSIIKGKKSFPTSKIKEKPVQKRRDKPAEVVYADSTLDWRH